MSFINNAIANMSEQDRNKLGSTGTKINTAGEHLLTITKAFEIGGDTGSPRFVLEAEDANGKKIDTTLFLTSTVGKKDGVVQAGEYSVNGVKTYLDTEGAKYDNLRSIGTIRNLWQICGLPVETFGAGVQPGTITYAKAGTKATEEWTQLIGKQFTGITSFYITADDKDPKKFWRNQKLNTNEFFSKDRLSQAEIDTGKTEPVAIEAVVKAAIDNPEIEFKSKNNPAAIAELNLIKNAGKPVAAPVATQPAANPF